MSYIEDYDVVVLGSGEAGKYLAWHFAGVGKSVAVVERRYVGGSCPNIACLPSKNVIHSAKVASYFQRGKEFGMIADNWHVDMSVVRDRKRKMVDGLLRMHQDRFDSTGAKILMGTGRFVGERTLEVALERGGVRTLRGEQVVVSTGTRATIDSTPGLAEASPLTHIEALELDVVPEHLLILGGGYIGLEFAQAMRRLGSQVTVVERNSRLAHHEDQDVSDTLLQLFRDEGIGCEFNVTVDRVEGKSGEHVRVFFSVNGIECVLEGSHLLVATGRTPNTENIGLDLAGIATTDRGYIQVNERLETTAPGVWAVGDCAGSPHFTHIAFDDFRIVRDNILGGNRVTTGRQVPFCLFTDPELARIGLSESEARRQGIPYRLARIPMTAVLRTRTLSETRGFLKALVSAEDDRILGFTGFGEGAGEIMAPVQLAMSAGLPYTALRDMILTHPTLSEGLVSLFSAVKQPFDMHGQLIAHNLGHLADKILPLCMPAVRLHLTPSAPIYSPDTSLGDSNPVGVSKVGGYPDLPPGFEWPYWEGAPIPFLAQFRLDAVARFDTEGILPKNGMLYFFWDVTMQLFMYGGDPVNWKVVHYTGDLASLKRTSPPPGLIEYGETNPNRIDFESELTAPSQCSNEMEALLTAEEDQDKYDEFWRAYKESKRTKPANPYNDFNPHHHLLGCSEVQCNDPRPNNEWRLLFVIDSDRDAGLNWGDVGTISFLIREDDLRNGRFDNLIVDYEGG